MFASSSWKAFTVGVACGAQAKRLKLGVISSSPDSQGCFFTGYILDLGFSREASTKRARLEGRYGWRFDSRTPRRPHETYPLQELGPLLPACIEVDFTATSSFYFHSKYLEIDAECSMFASV